MNTRLSRPETVEAMPVLSIIIPTRNCEATLGDCLESVAQQTWTDFELIVQDAGSTDGTHKILKQKDHLIDQLHVESDRGIYDAMNRGIRRARGEWLYFLGADDQLSHGGVFAALFPLESDSQFVYGNVELYGSGIVGRHGQIYDGPFSRWKLCRKNICQQAIFYRKTLFSVLGEFDPAYPTLADWLFNIRAFAHEKTCPAFVDLVVANYCAEGLSNRIDDPAATHARIDIIKRELGWAHWAWANMDRLMRRVINRLN